MKNNLFYFVIGFVTASILDLILVVKYKDDIIDVLQEICNEEE